MQPIKPLIIYTVRALSREGQAYKSSFLAGSENNAITTFLRTHQDITKAEYDLTALPARCNDKPVTELHCLKYGTKFKLVHRGGKARNFDNDEYNVKSPTMTKYDYTPINRTYLCVDGEGNKHYVDAYEWCITEEEAI